MSGGLATPGPSYSDQEVEAYVAGWGRLYELDIDEGRAECYTNNEGPEKLSSHNFSCSKVPKVPAMVCGSGRDV